jgi:peptide/nickel transport system substrate-binding protein
MTARLLRSGLAAAAGLGLMASAHASELTIGLATDITSADPHFHNLGPNNAFAMHVFDRLIGQGPNQELEPGLATSWQTLDDETWEFQLREGVTFHDGTPFTADDVAFTIERAADVPNSPSSFGIYLKQITDIEVVDDVTIRLTTDGPYPLMPNDLSTVAIVSRANGEGAATEDYNSGKAAIGTGPYRFVEWVPGDRIVIERHDDYWGEPPAWERVTFRPITSGPARVAALLAGDVDVIEGVPTTDVAQLEANPQISLSSGISNRVIYLHLDSDRDESPFVDASACEEGVTNPLTDARVRRAISLAINREAMVDRVMEGQAIAAGQLLPDGFFGTVPGLGPDPLDLEAARELLAEAGCPEGFQLTIHGPNDRYINDAEITQAVAQMLTRAGIRTQVETMPASVFFSRGSNLEFSLMLVGWGSGTGEASSPLKSLLATFDPERGFGASNRGRYANPEMDRLLEEALATVDDEEREALLQEATEVAMADYGIIPLHFQVNTWGARRGLAYTPRTDEYTLATMVADEGS